MANPLPPFLRIHHHNLNLKLRGGSALPVADGIASTLKWDHRKRGAWEHWFPTVIPPVRLRVAAADLAELEADGNRISWGSFWVAARLR